MNLSLIKKIEFHEMRSSHWRIPFIETRFYIKEGHLKEFLKWCEGEDKWMREKEFMWKYYMEKIKKSKAKRPKFKMTVAGETIIVYPHENFVAVRIAGLHYICQHSFDIFPSNVHGIFYESYPEANYLGKLYTLKGEVLDVFSNDICYGFLLHREDIDRFRNSFVNWIRYRRNKNAKGKTSN